MYDKREYQWRCLQTAATLGELIEDAVLDELEGVGLDLREAEHVAQKVATDVLRQLDAVDP